MAETTYDLVIIGSGPAGYVGGIRAAQLGLSACVIEKDKPGGVCLNIGCIPSKALIHQAEVYGAIHGLKEMGIKVDTSSLNFSSVFKKSRDAADTLSRGVSGLLKKNKVPYIQGEATITGPGEVTLSDGKKVIGKNIMIATGSSPKPIPGFEIDEKLILSSDGALMLEKLPKTAIILGGGAIGCEFAHVWNAFGTEVVVIEMMEHLLPTEDSETVGVLERSFRKRGIGLHLSTKASGMKRTKTGVEVTVEGKDGKKESIGADIILCVVGRGPNTTGIGLEKAGITTERGFIPVGDYYQTSVKGIFAVGDVTSSPLLAHVAFKEAEIAVEFIAGRRPPKHIDPNLIPGAVYSEPQIASFGFTEERAKKENIAYKTASFPYRGAGKAVAIEKPEGMVKVLFDPATHEILGAHVVGADATELIHELLLAKSSELLPEDIADMIHAHPTLSEAVMESMRAAEGWAIHI